jgi:hypothetical protein
MDRITTPAERVITKCGKGSFSNGLKVLSRWTGKHITRIQRWNYPKSRGGTGGIIPTQEQQGILARALKEGIELSPEDFFFTGDELVRGVHISAGPAP